jgi:hypothetical protein
MRIPPRWRPRCTPTATTSATHITARWIQHRRQHGAVWSIFTVLGKEPNAYICSKLKSDVYKEQIFRMLGAK